MYSFVLRGGRVGRKRSYLNLLNTPFLRFARSSLLAPIVHTGSIFLSKKGKCPQHVVRVPNADVSARMSCPRLIR